MVDPSLLPAPLSARSTVLSLLLGAEPAVMTPADLSRMGQHFDIAPATVRVALARAVADGDLRRTDDGYELGERLAQRQRHQDEAVGDADQPWDGAWEMAVVVVGGRPGPERAALREALTAHRLGELREGVWTRPANLRRPAYVDPVLSTFTATPDEAGADLAARLWDLDGWAGEATRLLELLEAVREPAARLATAAAVVRHLSGDPLLPAELLPTGWPAPALRGAYRAYQEGLRDLLRELRG